jgi:hypothetical protein
MIRSEPLSRIRLGWRLIDCSFGVIGAIPLVICRRMILNLEAWAPVQRTHPAVQINI